MILIYVKWSVDLIFEQKILSEYRRWVIDKFVIRQHCVLGCCTDSEERYRFYTAVITIDPIDRIILCMLNIGRGKDVDIDGI
uniref:Transposase n=1 Tax=Syphacia muris TaxID=451379 RepID=A0A0N5AWF4_9BILA